MSELWTAIALFSLFHVLPSTPARQGFIDRFGRPAFMAVYSLISLVMFIWLFVAYWRAEHDGLFFVTDEGFRHLTAALMLAAFWLLMASLMHRPMILLTGETGLAQKGAVTGILRITRHPFLWSLVIWSLLHLINNADPAGLVLFGYFLLLALVGTLPIDKRRARLLGKARWRAILARTSNIPFMAILAGRQNLFAALGEIGWTPFVAALIAWGFVLHFHEMFFGMPVFY